MPQSSSAVLRFSPFSLVSIRSCFCAGGSLSLRKRGRDRSVEGTSGSECDNLYAAYYN